MAAMELTHLGDLHLLFGALPSAGPVERLPLPLLFVSLALCAALYTLVVGAFSVYLGPLSSFPGPPLAAFTKLYEAYHVLVKNDWLENLEALHKKHGPIVRIGPNELHFTDHEFCLKYHSRADLNKCVGYYGLLGKLLGGLPQPYRHSERKSIIQPLFTGKTLATFSAGMMNDQLDTLSDRLTHDLATGYGAAGINATHYLWAYTNDVMLSYLLGSDPGYLKEADLANVHDSLRAFSAIDLATALRAMPPIKIAFDWFPSLRRISPLGWIDRVVGTNLQPLVRDGEASLQGKMGESVLNRLWSQLGDEQMVTHEAAQAIFIGNESLLSNLTFLLHYMIHNPECVTKLRAELDTLDIGTYGHRVWRDPRVMRLSYLDALCRESTRLGSPGWHRQPRQINEAVAYGDKVIPPMTSMSFTLRMLEHDPAIYPDPEAFKPERWLGDSLEAQNNRKHSVTFGTGTRTCLGQFIARHVLRKTLACIIYNFDISLLDAKKDRQEGYRYLDTYPKRGHEGYFRIRLLPRFAAVDTCS